MDCPETVEERAKRLATVRERRAFIRRVERLAKRTLAARLYDNRQAVLRLAEMSKRSREDAVQLQGALAATTEREEELEDIVDGLRTTLANVRQDLAERSARRPVTVGPGIVPVEVRMHRGYTFANAPARPTRVAFFDCRPSRGRRFFNWLSGLVRW